MKMRMSSLIADQRGAAAAELVLMAAVLIVPLLSVADLGVFVFQGMQVGAAAQAGAQAARTACRPDVPPFTSTCTTLSSAVSAGVGTTALGTYATVDASYPKEGFYCTNSSNVLTLIGSTGSVSSPPSKPAPYTCGSVTKGSSALPGDYLLVKVNYTYSPLFPSLSVASLLPTTITRTAWIRLQ
jgi:hypothetical protein